MADRNDADGTDATDEESGFVFGESRTGAEASSAAEHEDGAAGSTAKSGLATDTLTMTVVGVCAVLLLLVVVGVQLFMPGGVAGMIGADGSGGPGIGADGTPTETPVPPTPTPESGASATPPRTGDAPDGAPGTDVPAGGETATDPAATTNGGVDMATPPDAGTPTDGGATLIEDTDDADGSDGTDATIGGTDTTDDGGGTDGGGTDDGGTDGGFVQGGGDDGPPSIESMSVLDDSQTGPDGGTLVFEVGWTVTDPDGNLRQLQVTLLDDPDGDTTTLARQPIDVGGGRSQNTTTFEVPLDEPLGEPYEVRLVAEDQFGNIVNETRREIADGEN